MEFFEQARAAMALLWRQHPALLYGLAFLLGCLCALHWHPILLLPLLCLWFPLLLKSGYCDRQLCSQLGLALVTMAIAIFYIKATIVLPDTATQKQFYGTAQFDIANVQLLHKHYGSQWRYSGTIKKFMHGDQLIAKNLAASIYLSPKLQLPSADSSYFIEGSLREVAPQKYVLLPNKDKPWLPVAYTYSLAKMRHSAKQSLTTYLQQNTRDPMSADFLAGIATGEFSNRLIQYDFARFGVQHIMAISGFHFAIVAAFLNFFLSLFLPRRVATLMLIAVLSCYFIFLGCAPSIMRAWFCALIALCAFLSEKPSPSLNSLGLALLAILIFDPQLCGHIGFQFSFAATAAILLLYPGCDAALQKIFVPRRLSQAIKMNYRDQHGYYFLCCCRQALALDTAVNIAALPITLFYFQKFPLMSLVYNLFFPFMVAIAMVLLMASIATYMILPPVGEFLHNMTSSYTRFILNYTHNIPSSFDVGWHWPAFPAEIVCIVLCAAFISGTLYRYRMALQRETIDDWAFL